MTYAAAISIVLISGIVSAFITGLVHRLTEFDLRREHHDVGSVVFLQLGVVFAVLLAFVFNEVWSEYNEAAQATDLEISAMHGAAMIAATLDPAQAKTILAAEKGYLEAVVHREWPMMAQNRAGNLETSHRFEEMLQHVARLRLTESGQQDTKAEVLSLLAQAHRYREIRIYQAKKGVPVPLWLALIAFTAALSLFVSFSGIKYRAAAIVMAACFTAGIAAILVIIRLLDYPFEGALALPPDGFIEVTAKVSNLFNQVSGR